MSRPVLVVVALVFVHVLRLAGQGRFVLAPGDRVRVTMAARANRLVGTVVAVDRDSLRIREAGQDAMLSVPESSVKEVEVRRWHQTFAYAGAEGGAVAGAFAGAALGATVGPDECSGASWWFCVRSANRPIHIVVGAVLGASIGSVLGAAIGSALHSSRWEPAPLNLAHVAITPYGAGLALAVRF
jgi:phage tail tape-measure protein